MTSLANDKMTLGFILLITDAANMPKIVVNMTCRPQQINHQLVSTLNIFPAPCEPGCPVEGAAPALYYKVHFKK